MRLIVVEQSSSNGVQQMIVVAFLIQHAWEYMHVVSSPISNSREERRQQEAQMR